jgi:hypothetical protein
MIETTPVTIELIGGYTDKKMVTHRRVTIGRRITGKELFRVASDPQAVLETQYNALILREKITEFGTLKMPVPMAVLLSLDTIDRDDLMEASNRFSSVSEGQDDEPLFLADNRVKLTFGYERNGLTYDVFEFGVRLKWMDEIEADKLRLKGLKRDSYIAAKHISRLLQNKGSAELKAPFAPELLLEMLESLDAVDISYIRVASEVWRQSFRRPGALIPEDRGSQRADPDDANRPE